MAINYQKLLNWSFPTIEQTYTEKDSILYALGVGLGNDPMDVNQLQYVFEEPRLSALPTMAAVLGTPGFWLRDPQTGVTWETVLHGEQGIHIHHTLPPAATIIAKTQVTDVVDKGAKRGAFIYTQRELSDQSTGQVLATLTATTIARSDGGFGGGSDHQMRPHTLPDRSPDQTCSLTSLPQAALIYRLSGDPNPLHASPMIAEKAGFDAPILHGLCTLGIAGHAILKACLDYDAERFRSMQVRFSAPVYPGETIRTEMWVGETEISFRSLAVERDVVVLNNGCVGFAPGE